MKRAITRSLLIAPIIILLLTGAQLGQAKAPEHRIATAIWLGGLIIDHNNIDLSSIPSQYIDAAQATIKFHYAHTSHGGQITVGLSRIESANSTFAFAQGSNSLPTEDGALCMYDGNDGETYITPELYWQGDTGQTMTHNTLNSNPSLNVSMWSWCTQLNHYTAEQTQEYLDAMTAFEAAHPSVTFVYMTGNAQATGEDGYNRWLRNEQIRDYCRTNNKILFDFADLDAWSNGDHATYDYEVNGTIYHVPVEHSDFDGNQAAHTTYTSCEQKGKAFWWLVAMLAGWTPEGYTSSTTATSGTTSTTSSGTATTTPSGLPIVNQPLVLTAAIIGIIVVAVIVTVQRK